MKILTPNCTATERQHILIWVRRCNKHVEHLKHSYTALFDVWTFDILTRETVAQEVGGVFDGFRYLKRCLQASLSLSLPAVFRLFSISLLAGSFRLSTLTESAAQASHKSMKKKKTRSV